MSSSFTHMRRVYKLGVHSSRDRFIVFFFVIRELGGYEIRNLKRMIRL